MLKMQRKLRLTAQLAICLWLASCPLAHAESSDNQLHFRGGLVSGNFSGAADSSTGNFSIANSIDIEYELIRARNLSFLIRTIFSYDLKFAVLPYAYSGIGLRYFLWSNSRGYDESQDGIQIKKKPNLKFYLGPEIGVSEAIVRQYTDVVQTTTALAEVGGNLGAVYQINNNLGIETQVGYSMGFGLSTVIVGATLFKAFLGLGVYF